jgi:hypothetical protein
MDGKTIAAVYTFAAHHHSGQGSRGYRLLCRAAAAWRRKTNQPTTRLGYWEWIIENYPHDSEIGQMYHRLAERYGGRV